MENIKHDYLNSVCTRIIKMLSPPSNENVVANILQKTSPIIKKQIIVVPQRTLSWEIVISSVLIGALIVILIPYLLKKIILYKKNGCSFSFDGTEKIENDNEEGKKEELGYEEELEYE